MDEVKNEIFNNKPIFRNYQLRWYEYVSRIEEERQIYDTKDFNYRKKEKPKLSRNDKVRTAAEA